MARVRRTLVPLAGLALLAAQIALPGLAMAKEALPVWACGADGGGVSARGGFPDSRGTIREKDTGQVVNDMPASAKGKAPAAMTVSGPGLFPRHHQRHCRQPHRHPAPGPGHRS